MSVQSHNQNRQLEDSCNGLIEKILSEGQRLISSEYSNQFQQNVAKVSPTQWIGDRIFSIFDAFSSTVEKMIKNMNSEYVELEKILQKNEGEHRKHIRVEQQLKLFSETQQQRLEDVERSKSSLVDTTNKQLSAVKAENAELQEKMRKLKSTLEHANQRITVLEHAEIENAQKLANYTSLQEKIKSYEGKRHESLSLSGLHQSSTIGATSDTQRELRSQRQTPMLISLTAGSHSPLKMHPIRKTHTPSIPLTSSSSHHNHNLNMNYTNNNNNNNNTNTNSNMLSSQKHSDLLKVKLDFKEIAINSQQQQQLMQVPSNFKDLKNILSYPVSQTANSQRKTNNASAISNNNNNILNNNNTTATTTSHHGNTLQISKSKEISQIYNPQQRTRSRNSEVNRTQSSQMPRASSSINTSQTTNNQSTVPCTIGATMTASTISTGQKELTIYSNTTALLTLNSQHKRIRSIGPQSKHRVSVSRQTPMDTLTSDTVPTQPQLVSQDYSDYLNQEDLIFRSSKENFSQGSSNSTHIVNRPHHSSSLSQKI